MNQDKTVAPSAIKTSAANLSINSEMIRQLVAKKHNLPVNLEPL